MRKATNTMMSVPTMMGVKIERTNTTVEVTSSAMDTGVLATPPVVAVTIGRTTPVLGEVRYNPMSYHNGSVWPHDNSIIAAGMGRYGFKDGAIQVMSGLFESSTFVDL